MVASAACLSRVEGCVSGEGLRASKAYGLRRNRPGVRSVGPQARMAVSQVRQSAGRDPLNRSWTQAENSFSSLSLAPANNKRGGRVEYTGFIIVYTYGSSKKVPRVADGVYAKYLVLLNTYLVAQPPPLIEHAT